MQIPSSPRKKVVIVGAGFGGLAAAQGLKNAPVDVTLVDRHNYHLFQPLLYQVATAALSPAQIAQPIRAIMKKQKNCTVALGEVTGVDTAAKTVAGHSRRIPYDYLVLATGATHTYFNHDAWETVAPGLKSVEDAINIRQRVLSAFETAEITDNPVERQACMTFVVIGGGPTGIEMSGAIAELARHTLVDDFKNIDTRQARILLIEASQRLLTAFPEKLSAITRRDLEKLGVDVITGQSVTNCTENGVSIGDTTIDCRTIVWAAGVKASPAAQWLNVAPDRAGRVTVNTDLSVPGLPDVFVIGDTAACIDANGVTVPGLAQPALQQGKHVAKTILSRIGGTPAPAPFVYNDLGTMATIGRGKAIVNLKHAQFSGFIAWLLWGLIHLIPLVGFRNRFIVAVDWVWSYFTHSRGVRLITLTKDAHGDL